MRIFIYIYSAENNVLFSCVTRAPTPHSYHECLLPSAEHGLQNVRNMHTTVVRASVSVRRCLTVAPHSSSAIHGSFALRTFARRARHFSLSLSVCVCVCVCALSHISVASNGFGRMLSVLLLPHLKICLICYSVYLPCRCHRCRRLLVFRLRYLSKCSFPVVPLN